MDITASNLGFREIHRLTQFIEYMIEHHFSDCCDCIFSYLLKADEPVLVNKAGIFYASDYDVAFDVHNNLKEI